MWQRADDEPAEVYAVELVGRVYHGPWGDGSAGRDVRHVLESQGEGTRAHWGWMFAVCCRLIAFHVGAFFLLLSCQRQESSGVPYFRCNGSIPEESQQQMSAVFMWPG